MLRCPQDPAELNGDRSCGGDCNGCADGGWASCEHLIRRTVSPDPPTASILTIRTDGVPVTRDQAMVGCRVGSQSRAGLYLVALQPLVRAGGSLE